MADQLVITTNSVPRDPIYWHDLTPAEQRWFDYLETEDEQVSAVFFRYRGNVYHIAEFLRASSVEGFVNWDCYSTDSYFSGILVRFVDDGDRLVVGSYYC